MEIVNIPSYAAVLEELKIKIRQAQQKAVLSVNKELILLHTSLKEERIPGIPGEFRGHIT